MALTNTRDMYGWLSILLHWTAALGVIAMFATGFQAGWAEQAGDRAARGAAMGLHISIGATLLLIFAARIAAHYAQTQPVKPAQPGWLNLVASRVQHLLLLAILVQIVSGPLAVWSGGRAINVFDLFSIPSPFATRNDAVHEAAQVAHLIGRATLFFLIPLHVLGAVKHFFMDGDGVLERMFWPSTLREKS